MECIEILMNQLELLKEAVENGSTPHAVVVEEIQSLITTIEGYTCDHEFIRRGRCTTCGQEVYGTIPRGKYCYGRGWYHDGSERQDAYVNNREPEPCPYCKDDPEAIA